MQIRFLVVDDASFVRDTIKRTLRRFIPDCEVFDAANGHRALPILKSNKINIILSDWEMPEMSGEELLQWVRGQERYEKTPFIMVSSRGDRDHVMRAIQAGVSDYLGKPFTPEELQAKVVKQLQRIGFKPRSEASASSLDVLTARKKATVQKPREVKAAADFAKPVNAPAPKPKNSGFDGRAHMRFPGITCECAVKDISLQAVVAITQRQDKIPALFEQAVIDLEDADKQPIARLNGFVQSIAALENSPDANRIKIHVRFVDNDPEKFEVLSKLVAG